MDVLMSSRKNTRRSTGSRLVTETGRPIAHVAAELGIGAQLLGRWVHAEQERSGASEPVADGPLGEDERAELARLRSEVRELRMDNEFLGKAAAFFASKPPRRNGSS